jgi:hypothetical protein
MHLSAAIAIFATIAVAGLVVIPVILALMRRGARRDELWAKDPPVPLSFVIMIFVIIAAAIFGLAGPSIFPDTWWGNFMATSLGSLSFLPLRPCGHSDSYTSSNWLATRRAKAFDLCAGLTLEEE